MNCALLDSGCSSTVCGNNWLKCYTDTLPEGVDLQECASLKSFQFGPGDTFNSIKQVNIPVDIAGMKAHIVTDVVDCEIPLLLSKSSLKAADSQLDFVNDTVTMFGKEIALQHTSNGHYCVPLTPKQVAVNMISNKVTNVNFTVNDMSNKTLTEKKAIALKLHKQFGHPVDSNKLKGLLQEAKIHDNELLQQIDIVTKSCDTCSRYMKARSRPVVSLPIASDVNDCMALDLKFLTINERNYTILHMIDVFSRFSAATLVKSKHAAVIVDAILKHWVAIFGAPHTILSDNGGEFNNDLLQDVAELLGSKIATTAAESPWSNGIVERHNAVIGNMVTKIVDSTSCSVENALVWSVSAKNSLHNNGGFSPNQLVFGRNPNLPSVLTAKPPGLRFVTPSQVIAEHLNALHAARKAFTESESSRKIKTALQRQTRTSTSKECANGDHVYYKRQGENEWRGPGLVLGIDGKQVMVRHGGKLVHVSPCSLQHVNSGSRGIQSDVLAYDESEIKLSAPLVDTNVPNQDEPREASPNQEHLQIDGHTSQITYPDTDELQITPTAASDNLNTPEEVTVDEESSTVNSKPATINIPKVHDRIRLVDPDTNQLTEFLIVSHAGKMGKSSSCRHKYWFNVKDVHTKAMKSINFEAVPDWEKITTEAVFNVESSVELIKAQQLELDRWKQYNVFNEVSDNGQEVISTRWVFTQKSQDGETKVKARLVARGFEEDTADIRTDSPTISK